MLSTCYTRGLLVDSALLLQVFFLRQLRENIGETTGMIKMFNTQHLTLRCFIFLNPAIEGIIKTGEPWENVINITEIMLTSWKERERRGNLCGELIR
jgi:hypothetical protein